MKQAGRITDFSIAELATYKRINFSENDTDTNGRPLRVPTIPLSHQVVARVDYGDTSSVPEFFICDSIEDMQSVYASGCIMKSPAVVGWYSRER